MLSRPLGPGPLLNQPLGPDPWLYPPLVAFWICPLLGLLARLPLEPCCHHLSRYRGPLQLHSPLPSHQLTSITSLPSQSLQALMFTPPPLKAPFLCSLCFTPSSNSLTCWSYAAVSGSNPSWVLLGTAHTLSTGTTTQIGCTPLMGTGRIQMGVPCVEPWLL